MFVILFSIGCTEVVILRRIAKNLGLPEALILLRQVLIAIYSWIISPALLKYLDKEIAVIIMFVITVLISYIFVRVSDHFKADWFKLERFKEEEEKYGRGIGKNKNSILIWILSLMYFKNKPKVTWILFVFSPFLFPIYYRKGHHRYDGFPTKKVWILFLISSFVSSLLWAGIILLFKINTLF